MNILLTGGAGYIGSHTCIALREAGFEPVILDNFASSRSQGGAALARPDVRRRLALAKRQPQRLPGLSPASARTRCAVRCNG